MSDQFYSDEERMRIIRSHLITMESENTDEFLKVLYSEAIGKLNHIVNHYKRKEAEKQEKKQ